MHRALLLIGGGFNVILTLFHVFLGRQLHLINGVTPGQRALMEMLNAGGTLMVAFFAVASFACVADILNTRLGRLFLWFVVALYVSRAAEEIVVAPHFSAVIFVACAVIAALYAAVAVVPLPATATPAHVAA